MPPLPRSILKNKRKAKHHILPFSGSAHHIPVHSSLILAHFSVFRYHSTSFRCHSISFGHIPVHSVPFLCLVTPVIPARSGIFRYHSCPFRFIPASFCAVPLYSGLFRYIPFRSVPVFSNARNFLLNSMSPQSQSKR